MRVLERLAAVLVLLLAGLTSCGGAPVASPADSAQPVQSGNLTVVATFSVIGDLVENVGGDRIDLITLVGPGGDAHTFEPTPEDGKALARARVVFENGLAFESWLDELYSASGSNASRVTLATGVTPRTIAEAEHGDQSAPGEEHGEFDPHVWHDVANVILMVEQIRAGLAAADPANAAIYQANADTYVAALKELDAFVLAEVGNLPPDRRKLVTTHDTFGYFAARYGFTIVGTGLGSASTEIADPSSAQLAELITEIKAAGVPAIFAENVSNPQLMETIAREAGVALGPPLYTDALGEPGSGGATYIEMMRANVTAIVGALK